MGSKDLKAKIRLEGDATGANKAIKSTEKGFSGLAKKLKAGALSITAGLASVVGAIKLLEDSGARLGQRRSLERSLEAAGDSIDTYVPKLKNLANNQIATSDIILASNRALALGISKDDIPGLLEAATKASVALGISATAAFNDITTGVGRASPLILDNLGIVVDAVKVYKDFADAIGTSVDELTKQQKTAALSAAVMKNASKGAEDFADAQSRVTVAIAKSKTALKEWFEQTIDSIAKSAELEAAIIDVSGAMSDYAAAIRGVSRALLKIGPEQEEAEKRFLTLDRILAALPHGLGQLSVATREYGQSVKEAEANQKALNEGLAAADAAYESATAHLDAATHAQTQYTAAQDEALKRRLRIEASIKAEASALDKLRASIGEVTQAELQKELGEITAALAEARIETGGNTAAFLEMEAKVVPVIDHMRARIKGLADGTGDIGEMAAAAAVGVDKLVDALGDASRAAGDTDGSMDDLDESIGAAKDSTNDFDLGMRTATQGMKLAGAQAIITAKQFDELRKSAGDAAAVAAALAGGGVLSQGGTRIRLPGGGSRLVNTTGISSYELSKFGTGGRFTINASGDMVPI
ncbi:MAG: hypothetical protein V3V65_07975 [Hyphomicrobium sp.]